MTFAVSGSAVSASPIGQALQIHPKPQSKESANFELSEIKHDRSGSKMNYCPSYFKYFNNDDGQGTLSKPCKNGGKCSHVGGSDYKCACPAGWSLGDNGILMCSDIEILNVMGSY